VSVVFEYIDRYRVELNDNDKIFQYRSLTHSYKLTIGMYMYMYIPKLTLFIFGISMVYTPK